jgi:UDP-glucose 4-epimerase
MYATSQRGIGGKGNGMRQCMKIVVIGGAGFIGSHITKAYLNAGHDVVVVDNLSHGSRDAVDSRARFYQLDIRDMKIRDILQQERPTVVNYHAVQHYSVSNEQALTDADVHIRGLINVLEGCIAAQVDKFIFASNGNSLYDAVEEEQLPATEDMPRHQQGRVRVVRSLLYTDLRTPPRHFALR